jgi:putative membrane protein
MFIDYVTLMLINMAAALTTLAVFLWKDPSEGGKENWAPAFALPGLVAAVCGFAMIFTWPLPKPYNKPYGEMSVLLGMLFLAASWSLAKGWKLQPLGIYAFFAGFAAVLLGISIIHFSLTQSPVLSGAGFILTGLGGVFAGLVLRLHKIKWLRIIGSIVLLASAAIWALTGYMAYWIHMIPPKV